MGSFSPKKKFQARHWSPRFWLVGSPGFEPGSRTPEAQVDYSSVREDLITWLGSRNLGDTYRKRIIRELDRWVTAIGCPMDVVEVFSGLTAGQKNNLNRAIRALFNFLGSQGWSKDCLVASSDQPPRSARTDEGLPFLAEPYFREANKNVSELKEGLCSFPSDCQLRFKFVFRYLNCKETNEQNGKDGKTG